MEPKDPVAQVACDLEDSKIKSLLAQAWEFHEQMIRGSKLSKEQLHTIERVHGLLLFYFEFRKDLFPAATQALEIERGWLRQKLGLK